MIDRHLFTLPNDLRRMRCRRCKDGVFLGQDVTEVCVTLFSSDRV